MLQKIKMPIPVFISMVVGLGLSVYGNRWGLPSRFHSDEVVTNALHMAGSLSWVDPISDFVQLTGYQLFLVVCFIPVYLLLRVTGFPLGELKAAASVSWFEMANKFPEFATGIYVYARTISAILGALTIYFVYRLTERVYGRTAGIYASSILALGMGFNGFNHLAKSQPLLNLISVLILFFMVLILQSKDKKKLTQFFLFGSALTGLATSIHLEGPFLLLALGLTFLMSSERKASWVWGGALCFLFGMLLGTPSLITHFSNYFGMYPDRFETQLMHAPKAETIAWWISPVNHFLELCVLFGVPFFILIVSGLFGSLKSVLNFKKEELLLLAHVIGYFLVITLFLEEKYPEAKHIILIIPPLAIFGGRYLSEFLKSSTFFRYGMVGIIFVYSLFRPPSL